jgi:hypothetical protein
MDIQTSVSATHEGDETTMNNKLVITNSQVRTIVRAAKKRGWTFSIENNALTGRYSNGAVVHTHCHRQSEQASSFRQFAKDLERVERQSVMDIADGMTILADYATAKQR